MQPEADPPRGAGGLALSVSPTVHLPALQAAARQVGLDGPGCRVATLPTGAAGLALMEAAPPTGLLPPLAVANVSRTPIQMAGTPTNGGANDSGSGGNSGGGASSPAQQQPAVSTPVPPQSGTAIPVSAAVDEPPRVTPPVAFGIVEPGVYRSNVPTESNLEYLQGLGLRTALYLSPELPTRALREFFAANSIELHHLGLETWRPADDTVQPINEELVKESLELLLDGARHPLLLLCSSGLHHTGVLVGCLRRLQQWNLTSILQVRLFAAQTISLLCLPAQLSICHLSMCGCVDARARLWFGRRSTVALRGRANHDNPTRSSLRCST